MPIDVATLAPPTASGIASPAPAAMQLVSHITLFRAIIAANEMKNALNAGAELHASRSLSDAEFAAVKPQLLDGVHGSSSTLDSALVCADRLYGSGALTGDVYMTLKANVMAACWV